MTCFCVYFASDVVYCIMVNKCCYETSTLLYNVVIFILYYCILSFVIKFVMKHLFAYYCFIRGTYVLLTCETTHVSLYSFGIDFSCDLTCCVRGGPRKPGHLYYHVMRNSNTLDRLVNAVSSLFIECSLFLLTSSVLLL